MKIFKRVIFALLIIIILALVIAYFYLKATAPQYEGSLKIKGLHEKVDVIFDEYGIPHIYAQNEHDAYLALGYVHAQDRIFQMEMLRRVTNGRLSEILGESMVNVDKTLITLGIDAMGKRCEKEFFEGKTGDYQDATMAYLKGLNGFIDAGKLPVEFIMLGIKPKHFSPADVYATIGYMAFGFTAALKEEPFASEIFNKLGNDYLLDFELDSLSNMQLQHKDSISELYYHSIWMARDEVEYKLPIPYWHGSNNWAISSEKSKSGKVLLGNDTHIKYGQPAVWFEAYIEYPGHQMYGYFLAGVPFPIIGHNQDYGWGLTIFPFDNLDLYAEKQNPANKNQYAVDSNWVDYQTKTYSIPVKGKPSVDFELKFTGHGPIINSYYPEIAKHSNDNPISLWWSVNKLNSTSLEATYRLSHAKDFKSFEAAMPLIDILGLNVVYGDKKGNIAWWATGKIPKRHDYVNSKLIIDGSKSKNDLLGFYRADENPRSVNPECGYIITANNPPYRVNGILYSGYYSPGYRAKRIEELVIEKGKLDMNDMKAIQNDVHSDRDLRIRDLILSAVNLAQFKEYSELVAHMKNWDGNYDVKSIGATVFTRLIYFVLHEAMVDEIGEESFTAIVSTNLMRTNIEKLIFNNASKWWDIKTTVKAETRKEIFEIAFLKTMQSLRDKTNKTNENLEWGNAHTLTHNHPIGSKKPFDKIFNVGPFPKSGSLEVIDKEGFDYNSKGEYVVTSGPAMRMLVDFASEKDALGIIPTGQSGNFMSPHYSDQAQLFVDGQYRKQITTKDYLKQHSRTLILEPLR